MYEINCDDWDVFPYPNLQLIVLRTATAKIHVVFQENIEEEDLVTTEETMEATLILAGAIEETQTGDLLLKMILERPPQVKVGFFQKVMAKFSNLSNRHACEPKIVPELLFPVHVVTKILKYWRYFEIIFLKMCLS